MSVPDHALRYPGPLVEGVFLARRKRFFADVRLPDGTEVVAHCANTGSMKGVGIPGLPCRVLHHDDPKRKLAWSLEQLCVDGTWTCVNTARPNRVVEAAVAAGAVDALSGFETVAREPRLPDGSRADLLLFSGGAWVAGLDRPKRIPSDAPDAATGCVVEVKHVTWVRDGVAVFPDAVSTRATRHLEALSEVVDAGHRAVLVLHVGRADATRFVPAADVDPTWAHALAAALDRGVEVLALRGHASAEALWIDGTVPWATAGG